MPPIKSLVSKYYTYTVALILLLSAIIPIYSYYTEKKLICITITAPFSHQPSSYSKCIQLNICFSCNVRSVSNTKYIFLTHLCSL